MACLLYTSINRYDGGPHEANFLKLDCSKLKSTFGWKPRWNLDTAMEKVVEWSKCYAGEMCIRDSHICCPRATDAGHPGTTDGRLRVPPVEGAAGIAAP